MRIILIRGFFGFFPNANDYHLHLAAPLRQCESEVVILRMRARQCESEV